MVGDQIDVKDPTRIPHLTVSQSVKAHHGKWILVNFEGTSLNFSMIFPLFLKFPLTFVNMGITSFVYSTTK